MAINRALHTENLLLLIAGAWSVATLGVYLYFGHYYSDLWSDPAYYYAVGKSFLESGKLANITVLPVQHVLNAHLAIALIHSGYQLIFDNPLTIFMVTPFLGFLLFWASLKPLILLSKSHFSIERSDSLVIFLIMTASPVYMWFSLQAARTEAFFFPLVLFWSLVFLNWSQERRFSAKYLFLLIGLSVLLYAFRLQALILFLAAIISLLWHRDFLKAVAMVLISGLSVAIVLGLNYLLSGITFGQGETQHAANITLISSERVIHFVQVLGQFFVNADQSVIPWLTGILFLVISLFHVYLWYRNASLPSTYATLLIFGSLLALFLFRNEENTIQLRYIYYALPFLWITWMHFSNSVSKINFKNVVRFSAYGIVVFYAFLFSYRYIFQFELQKQFTHTGKAQIHKLKDVLHDEKPENQFVLATVRMERLLYTLTGKPGITDFEFKHPEQGDLLLFTQEMKDNSEISSENLELLTTYYLFENYMIYRYHVRPDY